MDILKEIELELRYVYYQGYDGATIMGCFNGVQALVTKYYPLTHYVNCSFYYLDLVISAH